jgi:hypothetical protein
MTPAQEEALRPIVEAQNPDSKLEHYTHLAEIALKNTKADKNKNN